MNILCLFLTLLQTVKVCSQQITPGDSLPVSHQREVTTTKVAQNERKQTHRLTPPDHSPALVEISGDPHEHHIIRVKVTTPSHIHNLHLKRAESILHKDVKIISIESGRGGEPVLKFDNVQEDIYQQARQFFHNVDTGAVISVLKQADEHFHIEGYLDFSTIIAPPMSGSRHRREVRDQGHTVYKATEEDFDRDWINEGPLDGWAGTQGNQILNSVLDKDRTKLTSRWERLRELIENHRELELDELLDNSHEEDDAHEEDYVEVPAIFDNEEKWRAHQSRALERENEIDENNKDMHVTRTKSSSPGSEVRHRRDQRSSDSQEAWLEHSVSSANLAHIKYTEGGTREAAANVKNDLSHNGDLLSDVTDVRKNEDKVTVSTNEKGNRPFGRLQYATQIPRPSVRSLYKPESIPTQAYLYKSGQDRIMKTTLYSTDRTTLNNLGTDSDPAYAESPESHKTEGRNESDSPDVPTENRVRGKRQVYLDWSSQNIPGMSYKDTIGHVHRSHANFTVEVMAVVDARTYKEFRYDWKAMQIFLLHFWQSVNARFRSIIDPNVHLKLKSIVKVMFPGFQPFIENNRVKAGSTRVDVDGVLADFRSYVSDKFEVNSQLPDHDIVILLTGEDLCKARPDGTWSKKSRGIAYVRGACISARRFLNQTYDVGVAEVGRSFRGVLTTAHEVGHLLGAFHDGEKNASGCPSTSGHLMSYDWLDPYRYNRFSTCSKRNLKHFMENTWYSECLLSSDTDHLSTYAYPSTLPGQQISLADQCRFYIDGKPCSHVSLESQCGRLCCEKWSQAFPSKEPAADGTYCGPGKMCYNGECLLRGLIPL